MQCITFWKAFTFFLWEPYIQGLSSTFSCYIALLRIPVLLNKMTWQVGIDNHIHILLKVYSCANAPKVDVLEKMFAYMPQGCQVISVDIFQSSETPLELITGIKH